MISKKGARTKGHSWERQIAKDLRGLDSSAKRVLEYQEGLGYDIQTRLPLKIQAKSQKRPNLMKAMKEAEGSVVKGSVEMPMAVIKITNKGEYALMRWSDLLIIMKKAFIRV